MTFSYRYPDAQIDNRTDYLEIKVLQYKAPNIQFDREIRAERTARETIQNKFVSSPSALNTANETLKTIDKNRYGGGGIGLQRGKDQYKSKEESLGYIFLPMPKTVADSQGVTWNSQNLNPFAAAGIGAGMGVIKSDDNFLTALAQGGSDFAQRLYNEGTNPAQKNAIQAFFATQAVNAFGAQVSADEILARTTGQILNQNAELLFSSVQLRTFSFSFDFAPRRRKESETVKNIIRTFKKNMSPKKKSGIFLNSPNIFQLCYKTGRQKHAYLNSFFPTALTKVGVSYNPDGGQYATYEDTSPVKLSLTLDFSEISPIYEGDYDEEDGLIGVGY
tara:strand:+ start:1176 stop:2174 length:999 start_codon:yes stop_codon:yes gene_type:complete